VEWRQDLLVTAAASDIGKTIVGAFAKGGGKWVIADLNQKAAQSARTKYKVTVGSCSSCVAARGRNISGRLARRPICIQQQYRKIVDFLKRRHSILQCEALLYAGAGGLTQEESSDEIVQWKINLGCRRGGTAHDSGVCADAP
jgi:NAD(P)-dependent dehydrogenase (short-subunit alcohol dehydrogenase family)